MSYNYFGKFEMCYLMTQRKIKKIIIHLKNKQLKNNEIKYFTKIQSILISNKSIRMNYIR